ncbi:hypothetical protein TL16_g13029 [Triparma laevis f. inornata]|uniref:Uncharacterized protein n=1 Tax=Triparma laevis f. inornata TaxID=1714386 RepID=A0A9W7BQG5_9STRA|nr:hypothetical protein TL16_g13029 [Triparma laevis f. inornata]
MPISSSSTTSSSKQSSNKRTVTEISNKCYGGRMKTRSSGGVVGGGKVVEGSVVSAHLSGLPLEVLTHIVGFCAGINHVSYFRRISGVNLWAKNNPNDTTLNQYYHLSAQQRRTWEENAKNEPPIGPRLWRMDYEDPALVMSSLYSVYLKNLALVSKQFLSSVHNLMYEDARTSGPSQSELVALKSRAQSLDLTYLKKTFLDSIKIYHGQTRVGYNDETNLELFKEMIDCKTDDQLFSSVLRAYKMFLVVKAVELSTQSSTSISWSTKCNAPHIVDLLWHAHILHTKKYSNDCKKLCGEMVHHEPEYWLGEGEKEEAGFEGKVRALFKVRGGEGG